MKLIAALAVGLIGLTACDSGPTCEEQGGRVVHDPPLMVPIVVPGPNGTFHTQVIWHLSSHCELPDG